MEVYCEKCDYTDYNEVMKGSMSLQECKDSCLADITCTAIDYPNTGGDQCYHNYQVELAYSNAESFDSWIKVCAGKPSMHNFFVYQR